MQRSQRVAASASQRRTRSVFEKSHKHTEGSADGDEGSGNPEPAVRNVRAKVRHEPKIVERKLLDSLTDIEDLAKSVVDCGSHTNEGYHHWRKYKGSCLDAVEDVQPPSGREVNSEAKLVADALLQWYGDFQRSLPWRVPFNGKAREWISKVEQTSDQRAYEVWISEIMLSQTRVATVINYWLTWMAKWPTMKHLAEADLEEVNKVWSGLGYYSRARRLHEAAGKVVREFGGKLPENPDELEKSIPGVGRYTAGAISSIAYNKVTPLVDGNVVRVLTRLLAIGGDPKTSSVIERLWFLATELVENADPRFPGDHNQALMELGAVVCTPTAPKCKECPVSGWCRSFAEQNAYLALGNKCSSVFSMGTQPIAPQLNDGANVDCDVCEPIDLQNDGRENPFSVTRFPRKTAKKAKREEETTICIFERFTPEHDMSSEYLLTKRPKNGLLAGLWDFPATSLFSTVDGPISETKDSVFMMSYLTRIGAADADDIIETSLEELGGFIHIFSHIRMTYRVLRVKIKAKRRGGSFDNNAWRWISSETVDSEGIPTTARKALKMIVPSVI